MGRDADVPRKRRVSDMGAKYTLAYRPFSAKVAAGDGRSPSCIHITEVGTCAVLQLVRTRMLPDSEMFVLTPDARIQTGSYSQSGQRVTAGRPLLGLDFGRGTASFIEERPRVVPRGFCFDPVRRVRPTG